MNLELEEVERLTSILLRKLPMGKIDFNFESMGIEKIA